MDVYSTNFPSGAFRRVSTESFDLLSSNYCCAEGAACILHCAEKPYE